MFGECNPMGQEKVMATEAAVKKAPASKLSPGFEEKMKKLRETLCRRGRDFEDRAGERDPLAGSGRRPQQPRKRKRKAPAGSAPGGQGLGADRDRTAQEQAEPSACGRFSRRCTATSAIKPWNGWAPFTICAGFSWITIRSCCSRALTMATGIRISTTLRPRSPTSWTFSSARSTVGPGFAIPR